MQGLGVLNGLPEYCRLVHQPDNLSVGHLMKVSIVMPDRAEWAWHLKADNLVNFIAEPLEGLLWSDWHCEYQSVRSLAPQGRNCRTHTGTGRNTIIDEDQNTADQWNALAPGQINVPPAFNLGEFDFGARTNLGFCDRGGIHYVVIDDNFGMTAVDNSCRRQLGLIWHTHLADEHKVERSMQGARDFYGHWNPAAWKRKHHGIDKFSFEYQLGECLAPLLCGSGIGS